MAHTRKRHTIAQATSIHATIYTALAMHRTERIRHRRYWLNNNKKFITRPKNFFVIICKSWAQYRPCVEKCRPPWRTLFLQSFLTVPPCPPHISPPVLEGCPATSSPWRPPDPEGRAESRVLGTVHGGGQPATDSDVYFHFIKKPVLLTDRNSRGSCQSLHCLYQWLHYPIVHVTGVCIIEYFRLVLLCITCY